MKLLKLRGLARLLRKEKAIQKLSFSQTGEDIIIDFIFGQLKMEKPSYLDIGAHHPTFLSNTYLFYLKGSRGVNIEPDPALIKAFNEKRSEDINLNVGIGFDKEEEQADFYLMSAKTLNTFSREEAERIASYGTYKIEEVVKLPLLPVNKILNKYFASSTPDFISLDVEGVDFEILKSINFDLYKPHVFCIETITYTEDKTEKKRDDIIKFMIQEGYFIYADTYINTIFVNKKSWLER